MYIVSQHNLLDVFFFFSRLLDVTLKWNMHVHFLAESWDVENEAAATRRINVFPKMSNYSFNLSPLGFHCS